MTFRPLWTRRHFLTMTAGTSLGVTLDSLVEGTRVDAAELFDARNAMRFARMPDTASLGLRDITVIYASRLWPKNVDKAEPDTTFLREHLLPKIRPMAPDILVIDIEHWHLATGSNSAIERNIDRYVTIIETLRAQLPGTRLGVYGMIPIREYWAPVNGSNTALAEWRSRNKRLRRLGDAVDIVFPSLYTFYDDPSSWDIYARANLSEAHQYGKPVYGFLWPQFHGSRDPVPANFWRQQLETVHDHGEGLVIWSPARGKPRWDANAPWWLETLAFLKDRGRRP